MLHGSFCTAYQSAFAIIAFAAVARSNKFAFAAYLFVTLHLYDHAAMGVFQFIDFAVDDSRCGQKICSDAVVLGAWTFNGVDTSAVRSVIDVGCGSGILSLLAARACPYANVTGLEIDADAAADARANFAASPWTGRLALAEGHFADFHPATPPDIIISNPPFFNSGEISPDACRASARHEISLTYPALFNYARTSLTTDGRLCFISPAEREDELLFACELAGLKLRRICRMYTSAKRPTPSRLLWTLSPSDGPITRERLDIRDYIGNYTEAYLALVGGLYHHL